MLKKSSLQKRVDQMTTWQELNDQVQLWLKDVRKQLIEGCKTELAISQKTSRLDLVTNIDKQVEKYLVEKIRKTFPNSKILGEEGDRDQDLAEYEDLLWIIDPLDGTMNFVKQKDHFASMIAIYENGQEKLGYILDVVNNELYWGGPECGVFCNDKPLPRVLDLSLSEGLLDVSGQMLLHDYRGTRQVAKESLGIRIYGSAGISFIHVLTGKTIGYFSHLHPWDYAAGQILANTQGLTIKSIDDSELDVLISNDVLVATKNAGNDILKLMKRH